MYKVGLFQGNEEHGPAAVPLFGAADSYFEKVASATLLPEVSAYIASLKPRNDSQYVLVNAMGAGEYYGSNINGDRFSTDSLIHRPDTWSGIPSVDKLRAADWAYGFPTFYRAHVFAHHRNKDPTRALGFVELAAWNPHMKRVELVTRLEHDRAHQFGGDGIWDKLKANEFPDVSMGTKVPFDTCSICLDQKLYRRGWEMFDPKKYKSPGEAILAFHKKLKADGKDGIRGLSITRADYCEHARMSMNRILPDGRKVWVDNDFPSFFDISFVFIGADKIAKAMMKIASAGRMHSFMGSAELAEKISWFDGNVKLASAHEDMNAFVAKLAQDHPKQAEMKKEVVPNQFAGKAVPILTDREEDLPEDVLNMLGTAGLPGALSSVTGMGMVLRPREFQRVVLVSMGNGGLADQFDQLGQGFPQVDEKTDTSMSGQDFSPVLAQLLAPFMAERSAFGPIIERRIIVLAGVPPKPMKKAASHPSELLRKIGAAYNGYRENLMQLVPSAQDLIEAATSPSDVALRKLAGIPASELFTPLSFRYLSDAFKAEVPPGYTRQGVVKLSGNQASAGVQRVNPLVTTRMNPTTTAQGVTS